MRAIILAAVLLAGPALAPEAWAQDYKEIAAPGAAVERPAPFRTDTIEITLFPKGDMLRRNEGEYMVAMKPGDSLVYSLTTADTKALYHEFHGHRDEEVTFYKKAEGAPHHGAMRAPFEGQHGWFVENRSDKTIKVELKLAGFYERLDE